MLPPIRPLVSPVLVGRDASLETLRQLLRWAAHGRGQAVLISGEAGIGKSRLAAEARAQAEALGWRYLGGRCFEPDATVPFAPLADLLRAHVAGRPAEEVRSELGPAASELVALVPELAALPDALPSPTPDPEQARRRLFQAFATYVGRLAATHPTLILVEDVHWCDEASLDLLLYLCRSLSDRRVLVVLTYRTDELSAPLRHLLAELDRDRLASELALHRLSRDETERMLRAMVGSTTMPSELVDQIVTLTDGNPFFVEEIVRTLAAAGDVDLGSGRSELTLRGQARIPRSVEDAVSRRVGRLSPEARQVLSAAAVAGRRFEFEPLQAVLGWDEPELVGRIKELIAAQLVVEESTDVFAFRHALTREAVYAELLGRERRALHQSLVDAYERLLDGAADARLADLARHAAEAELWEKVLDYSPRAGAWAQQAYAPRIAARLFSDALAAAQRLGIQPPLAVYLARGLAHERLGDFEAADADYRAALDLARSARDARGEWQALLDLGLLWASRDYHRTGGYYEQALELAREIADPTMVAHSLNRIGNWQMNAGSPREAVRRHEEALALFESIADRPGIAQTLDLLGMAASIAGDAVRCCDCLGRAIPLFRELGDRTGLASVLASASGCGGSYELDTMALGPLRIADCAPRGEEALTIAHEIGWRAGETYAAVMLTFALGPIGAYARALDTARLALQIAEEIEHQQWLAGAHCASGALFLDLLALSQARTHLERALGLAMETGSSIWTSQIVGFLVPTCILQGELNRARELLRTQPGRHGSDLTGIQRVLEGARAELALGQGDADAALVTLNDLLGAPAGTSDAAARIPRLGRLRGEALTALRRRSEAEAELRIALDSMIARGLRAQEWRTHLALGNLYRAQRRHREAEAEIAAARGIADALAAGVPDVTLRDTFSRGVAAVLPPSRPPSPRRATQQAFDGLTERERQVAALVAQGRSNREIAGALIISELTAASHVSNILTRLGFTSRAQIAAWATEKGLVPRRQGLPADGA